MGQERLDERLEIRRRARHTVKQDDRWPRPEVVDMEVRTVKPLCQQKESPSEGRTSKFFDTLTRGRAVQAQRMTTSFRWNVEGRAMRSRT